MKTVKKGKKGKKGKRRGRAFAWLALLFLPILLCVFALPVSAEESMPEGFGNLADFLPDEERELLSEGMRSGEIDETGRAVTEMMSPERLFEMIEGIFARSIPRAMSLFATLCGLLLFSAVLSALTSSLSSSALAGALQFLTTTAIFSAILSYQYRFLLEVQASLERLSSLMGAMIPIAGSVWAMGGNVGTATVGTTTLYAFLTVTEHLLSKSAIPVCCFCMAAALCQAISSEPMLRGVASAVKRIYTFTLGFVMTFLLASLSTSTTLAAAADSVAARTAKLVSSTVIPTVGGSVGETLRTVAASVQYLKSVVGIGGILLVLLLVLPTLLSLIAVRLVFLLAGGVAEMLGCEREARLLGELGSVFGCMLAVSAISGVMFILGLTVFLKSTVALA